MSTSSQLRCACVVLAVTFPPMLGCSRSTPPAAASGITRAYDKPIPEAPSAGKVRLVSQKLQEDAKTVHWKWTIVGDRNWTGISGSDNGVELTGAYPLNATDRGGGTNAFECELVLSTVGSANGKTNLTCRYSLKQIGTSLSGAVTGSVSGGGVSGSGPLWVNVKPASVNQAVKVLLTDDQTLPLPLDTVLVTLKGETADGKPVEHSFKLKASE